MTRPLIFSLAVAIAALVGGTSCWAGEDLDPAAMSKALREASVPLEQGMKASERHGILISAKYEIEDGKLQLSIYTMNRDQFSEVIVDHKTGAIDKSEMITGEDLKAAGEQGAAMSKATTPLGAAVQSAVAANTGYRAVSAVPSIESGHPVATVVLMKGEDVKKMTQKLD